MIKVSKITFEKLFQKRVYKKWIQKNRNLLEIIKCCLKISSKDRVAHLAIKCRNIGVDLETIINDVFDQKL